MQAAVSHYWVIEEALQSLMNSRIQDEENWRMARSYRRKLGVRTGTQSGYTNGIVVNKFGVIIGETLNSSDKNKVFLYNDENYNLDYIGDVGGIINCDLIISSIIEANKEIAKNITNIFSYALKVDTGREWDYKHREDTIFGYVWSIEENKILKEKTMFSYTSDNIYFGLSGTLLMNSADFGNFHAGYMGRMACYGEGFDYGTLFFGGGVAEMTKDLYKRRFGEFYNGLKSFISGKPPYGDDYRDYRFNRIGMIFRDKSKWKK